jgi:hypothetical protein
MNRFPHNNFTSGRRLLEAEERLSFGEKIWVELPEREKGSVYRDICARLNSGSNTPEQRAKVLEQS